MTHYERMFGTDWEALEIDSATDRAYAIGASEVLGEDNYEELQAIYDEVGSAYDRRIVELAYEEGRSEARNINENADSGSMWSVIFPDESTCGKSNECEYNDSPELLNVDSLLERSEIDSTEAVSRPDFLNR